MFIHTFACENVQTSVVYPKPWACSEPKFEKLVQARQMTQNTDPHPSRTDDLVETPKTGITRSNPLS